jgi:gluconolactonase
MTTATPSERTRESVELRWDRRALLGAALGAAAAAVTTARAQAQPAPAAVSPEPAPRDWSGGAPLRYPDPDLVALDARFQRYILFNTPIQRLFTGSLWAEGPAWNGVGRYVVWSDIPNDRQLRYIDEDARVTTFRNPAGNSNGNTFDFQGRQLSCEHGGRRVARYEPDGSVTTIAERYDGKRLNSPNDVVVHPDGGVWFTDPPYGIRGDYEGNRAESETKEAVYRVDPQSGRVALVSDEVGGPNGLCFSPDYTKLYVADTGAPREIKVWDVAGTSLRNGRRFAQLDIPGAGTPTAADGIRCDADGNVWAGARPGVQVLAPDGPRIGMIRLPEVCANVCFGGSKRNRLFMTASQSLYAVYVGVRGAHIA